MGGEYWELNSSHTIHVYKLLNNHGVFKNNNAPIVSSHYPTPISYEHMYNLAVKNGVYFGANMADRICILDNNYRNDNNGFKSFLSAQYEAGTPVTVWYVLAEPEEEQIDLSAIQTIKGTNILTVDTEVQPAEMYIKYKK